MKAVLKHELSGYFHSLTAYVFGAFLLVIVGIGSMLYNIQQAVANFEYVLGFISLAAGVGAVLLIAVAAIYFAKKSVFEGLLPNIMKTLSLFERFYTFVNGVFDMTAIVFYLSVIVFFLFLCVQSLEKRRYN